MTFKTSLNKKKKEKIETWLKQGRSIYAMNRGLSISKWIHSKSGYDEHDVAAHIALLNKSKYGVLVLDNTRPSIEKASEGKFVAELINIYGVGIGTPKSYLEPIKSKYDFQTYFSNATQWYVHISSHGKCWSYASGNESALISAQYEITSKDIKHLWDDKGNFRPKLVFMSACEVGRANFIKAFDSAGVHLCIAPINPVCWHDAAVFITLFYYFLFVENYPPRKSFRRAIRLLPSKEGGWGFWEYGKRVEPQKIRDR